MLQGTLDVLNFADVLTIARRKRVTGTLRVRASQFNAMIHLSRGRVAGLDSAGVPGGNLAARAEEATALLLAAPHGTFELQPMEHTLAVSQGEALDVRAILAGARSRLEEWRELQQVVPGADARPRLAATLDSRQVVLTAELWRVVQAIDGHRSARSLAHQLGLSQRELGRALKELVEAGVVDVDGGPAAGPSVVVGSPPPDSGQGAPQRTIVIRSANDRPPSPAPDAAAWPSAG
jgi:DNA-binding transcriptional ArsR family regulator